MSSWNHSCHSVFRVRGKKRRKKEKACFFRWNWYICNCVLLKIHIINVKIKWLKCKSDVTLFEGLIWTEIQMEFPVDSTGVRSSSPPWALYYCRGMKMSFLEADSAPWILRGCLWPVCAVQWDPQGFQGATDVLQDLLWRLRVPREEPVNSFGHGPWAVCSLTGKGNKFLEKSQTTAFPPTFSFKWQVQV